jgi:hypothetical protein
MPWPGESETRVAGQAGMMDVSIRLCGTDDLDTLRQIAYETYDQTFRSMNTEETMNKYLETAFKSSRIPNAVFSSFVQTAWYPDI